MKMNDRFAVACSNGLDEAIKAAGGSTKLARAVAEVGLSKVTARTIARWKGTHLSKVNREKKQPRIPAEYVQAVHRATNVPLARLRPDMYSPTAIQAYADDPGGPGPNAHSGVLGGSIADRRMYCPGSYHMERSVIDARAEQGFKDTGGPAAVRGTALHAAMEAMGMYRLQTPEKWQANADEDRISMCLEFVGIEHEGYVITEKDATGPLVSAAADMQHCIDDTQSGGAQTELIYEAEVSLPEITGAFGTSDVVVIDPFGRRLVVIDYKFGHRPVYAKRNYGLMFYAAACLYGPEQGACKDYIDHVSLVIIQPEKGEKSYDRWDTSPEELKALIPTWQKHCELNPTLNREDLVPGWHCAYCLAKPVCASNAEYAAGVKVRRSDAKTVPTLPLPKGGILK